MNPRILFSVFSLLLAFGLSTLLCAQDATFSAVVTKNKVAVGEQFQLKFIVNGNAGSFRPPDLSAFRVLSGPNQSTSIQSINGSFSQTLTYYYVLMAEREGRFTIASASVNASGRTLQSNPITLEVVKGNTQAQQQRKGNNSSSGEYPTDLESNIFIRASVSKSKVYVGEPLTVSYKVYTRVNILNNALSKSPVFDGFWSEDLQDKSATTMLHDEAVDGIVFKVGEIKRTLLIPQRSGKLQIDALGMEFITRVKAAGRGNSIFDQFFGPTFQDVKVESSSKPITIQVLPIPEKDKPENFTGLVGQFTLKLNAPEGRMKENESGEYSIILNGTGNHKLIDPPALTFPDDLELYDPKEVDQVRTTDIGQSGTRRFDYLFIPRNSGEFRLPDVSICYFDPREERFKTLHAEGKQIQVQGTGGATRKLSISGPSEGKEVSWIGKDIRYVKSLDAKLKSSGSFFRSPAYWMLMLIFPILFAFNEVRIRRRSHLMADTAGWNMRNANAKASKRLRHAEKFLRESDHQAFYHEMEKALTEYISHRFSIPMAGLSRENMREAMINRGVEQSVCNSFEQLLSRCEEARYSPIKDASGREQMFADARELISKLELSSKR